MTLKDLLEYAADRPLTYEVHLANADNHGQSLPVTLPAAEIYVDHANRRVIIR